MSEKETPIESHDPFEEYQREADPTKRERSYAWHTAIGLQAVDGLETSGYLKETAVRNIEGEITISEAQALIESYYKTDRKQAESRTEEADKVSSRITAIIAEKGFTFSVAQYLSIHQRLFKGIYKHAGKIRDYNITKQEWVLDGDTVTYGNALELRATLDYDFAEEKAFDYTGLSMEKVIHHLAHFVSRLWQIHVFGEGNTRTTAVFFIKYLQFLGFHVTNDIFAKNAWYFRNAMVRANYNNLQKGIHETTEFLELFLRNLLLGENNPLQNRTMHVSGMIKKPDIQSQEPDIGDQKPDIQKMMDAGLTRKTATNAITLFGQFGIQSVFGRTDASALLGLSDSATSDLLKKLAIVGITESVSGLGKGKYRFNPAFFK
ncbi:MAG: Fic family protein [Clostridia bacterium]|nr:Fic family protein [Clostridia bacterium]